MARSSYDRSLRGRLSTLISVSIFLVITDGFVAGCSVQPAPLVNTPTATQPSETAKASEAVPSNLESAAAAPGQQQPVNPTTTTTTTGSPSTSTAAVGTDNLPKLHLILVVDETDPEVGGSLKAASVLPRIQAAFESLIPKSQINPKKTTEKPKDTEILKTIQDLDVKEQDSVLFYYIGQGAYDDPKVGTYLIPSGNRDGGLKPVTVTEVLSEVKKKNPKSGVVIFDLCNTVVNTPYTVPFSRPEALLQGIPGESPEAKELTETAKSLLFNDPNKGLFTLIVSSSPGQFAFVAELPQVQSPNRFEPLFTRALLDTLGGNRTGLTNWSAFARATQYRLDLLYQAAIVDRRINTVFDGRTFKQPRQVIEFGQYK